MALQLSFLSHLCNSFLKYQSIISIRGSTHVIIESYIKLAHILTQLRFVKKEPLVKYRTLIDLFVVDYYMIRKRFQLNYMLISKTHINRFRVSTAVKQLTNVPSITMLFLSANWLERECWDMYGLFFLNHCDLRRILTDYGFEGHPLCKDFPVVGYMEVSYDDEQKRVSLQPLKMTQEFRRFEFRSPWATIREETIKINNG